MSSPAAGGSAWFQSCVAAVTPDGEPSRLGRRPVLSVETVPVAAVGLLSCRVAIAISTSRRTMRPFGPVPVIDSIPMPASWASRRASGLVKIRSSCTCLNAATEGSPTAAIGAAGAGGAGAVLWVWHRGR